MKKSGNSLRKIQHPSIFLGVLFSVFMLGVRVIYSGQVTYLFLLWNLFLAAIPYFISKRLSIKRGGKEFSIFEKFLAIVWILFLPNAPYILTDLFHLNSMSGIPLWFDLILILFFAITGLLFWIISMIQMKNLMKYFLNKRIVYFLEVFLIFASGYGVYIGRYQRWNSWDLILHGGEILAESIQIIINPIINAEVFAMTFCFSLLLAFIYYSVSFWAPFTKQTYSDSK